MGYGLPAPTPVHLARLTYIARVRRTGAVLIRRAPLLCPMQSFCGRSELARCTLCPIGSQRQHPQQPTLRLRLWSLIGPEQQAPSLDTPQAWTLAVAAASLLSSCRAAISSCAAMKLLNLSRGAAGSRVPPASRSSAGPACSPLPAAAARGASRRLVSAAAAGPGAASFSGSTGQASFFSSDSGSTGSPAGQQLSPLQRWAQQNRQLQERLKSLGIAGVVAYGAQLAVKGCLDRRCSQLSPC